MSIDKAVDSTQLDSDLTSVANAIRTKGGTSAQLAFPAGFVQAIGDIETAGTDFETGVYIGAGSGNYTRSIPTTKKWSHFLIVSEHTFSQLTTQTGLWLYMAYGDEYGYTVVPIKTNEGGYGGNAVNNRLSASYDNWRSQLTFNDNSIKWAFLGNGGIVTPVTGETYIWFAW